MVDGISSRPCVDIGGSRGEERIVASGTVKKLVSERGFGFITGEDGKDYFFHRDGVEQPLDFDRLVGGEKVSFEVQAGPRGPRAVKVQAA